MPARRGIVNLITNLAVTNTKPRPRTIPTQNLARTLHKMATQPPPSNPGPDADLYAKALTRLAQLQSNRAVTSLFDTPSLPSDANQSPDKDGKPKDLNALAIPEMLAWLRRAGYTPESLADAGLRCVHVAGTKGKGSVCALVAGILQEYAGQGRTGSVSRDRQGAGDEDGSASQVGDGKGDGPEPGSASRDQDRNGEGGEEAHRPVGLYTSPHILSVRERISLNGHPIPPQKFGRYVLDIWERLTQAARREATAKGLTGENGISEAELDGPATKPFFFRFLTIVALHAFVSEGVRDAVVECGIGGEYDSTNVLPAGAVTAAVVTQLGIDHVGMLGDTVEKIAWHKSGVFKEGVKAFTRRLSEEQRGVMEALRARAKDKEAQLVEVGDEEVERWEGVDGARLQGPFQKYNMALAVYAAREHLLRTGVKLEGRFGTDQWSLSDIPPEFVKGLKEAALRGRCEVLRDEAGVEWHVDGAHTDDSLAGVGRWFVDRTDEDMVRVLVFNQQERDPAPLLRALFGSQGQVFNHTIFTRNEEEPAELGARDISVQTKAATTMREVDPSATTAVYDAVQPAVEQVRNIAAQAKKDGKQCKVLVTGSFHLAGAVLKTIEHVE